MNPDERARVLRELAHIAEDLDSILNEDDDRFYVDCARAHIEDAVNYLTRLDTRVDL